MTHILVADDEDSVRIFVTRALESHGYKVTSVGDGGAALAEVLDGDYDLLLTDIRMPVMDGIALALNVASKRPNLPVVLMSGYADEKQRAYNLDSLIKDVLSKPFTMDQLLDLVADYAPLDKNQGLKAPQ